MARILRLAIDAEILEVFGFWPKQNMRIQLLKR